MDKFVFIPIKKDNLWTGPDGLDWTLICRHRSKNVRNVCSALHANSFSDFRRPGLFLGSATQPDFRKIVFKITFLLACLTTFYSLQRKHQSVCWPISAVYTKKIAESPWLPIPKANFCFLALCCHVDVKEVIVKVIIVCDCVEDPCCS